MTVNADTCRYSYTGNGVTDTFAVPAKFFENEDLVVWLVPSGETEGILQELDTDYTATGAGDAEGGEVVFTTPPANGDTVILIIDPEAIQDKDYANADDFDAEAHEAALDRLTKIAQRHADILERCAKLPDYSTDDPPDPDELLAAAENAVAAAASADEAADSATAAATSATSAATSATSAATQATNAAASATAAANSATAAATSATAAAASATTATTQATNAATSASAASTSATNAANSATAAATSATNASNSATAAAASATDAADSATAAAASATSASNSAALAQAHIDDTTAAHAASAVSFAATGGIAATDVQAAIAELDNEKVNKATATFNDPTDATKQVSFDLSTISTGSNRVVSFPNAGSQTLVGHQATQTLSNKTLSSPVMTGTPTSTTAAVDTNTTQVATCAFVLAQAASAAPTMAGVAAVGTSTRYARADHVHPVDTSRAAAANFPTVTVDNTLPRFDGIAGAMQTSGVVVDDNNLITTAQGMKSVTYTMADDTNQSVAIPGGGTQALLAFTMNGAPSATVISGLIVVRGNAATAPVNIAANDATNLAFAATALGGTTGTDGRFTFGSPGTGFLHMENRLGASRVITLTWLSAHT